MRLYSFVNVYLSQLQKGLQTAHLVSEIAAETNKRADQTLEVFNEWATKHKTIIILDGGNHVMLLDIFRELNELTAHTYYPIGLFREDTDSLNSAATVCGVILPENVYLLAASIRNKPEDISYIDNSLFYSNEVLYTIDGPIKGESFDIIVTKRTFALAKFINTFRLSSS